MGSYNIPPGREPPFTAPNADPDVECPTPDEVRNIEDDAILAEIERRRQYGELVLSEESKRPR